MMPLFRHLSFLTVLACLALPAESAVDGPDTGDVLSPGGRSFQPGPPTGDLELHLEPIATGLEQPIFATAPLTPANGRQLFVIERTGRVRVIESGDLRGEPFLDLTAIVDWTGERGLLGLAFAPDYQQTGRFYVAYTDKRTFATVVARFRADVARTLADAASQEEILRIEQTPERIDHKAGWIGFRPGEPNFLYIASGDGGGHNDPDNASQNLLDRRGKILRVNVSGKGPGFAVPQDNPFVGRDKALPEIWAYGVRNPFRMSFDRETGDLFFGDVGQDAQEELNCEPAGSRGGRNYGWRLVEGRQRNRIDPDTDVDGITAPILAYAHEEMMFLRGCVIGGYVYRGAELSELRGNYFFGDFTNARVYSLHYAGGKVDDLTDWTPQLNVHGETLAYSGLVSLGEDATGELYVVDVAGGVFKVTR
jgi:glucose/arabinose dehydrogenase